MKSAPCRALLVISLLAPLTAISVVSTPGLARAQGEGGLARRLVREGIDAVGSGDWDTARERFERAYELAPRPLTLYNLATAQMNTGNLVRADENFRQFLRETSDGQHEQFRDEARQQREDLSDRIPFARVEGDGINRGDDVTLDDEPFSTAGIGENIAMNPGEHMLVVTRSGIIIGRREFNLREGQSQTVRVQLIESAIERAERSSGESGRDTTLPADDVLEPREEADDSGGGVAESPAFWIVLVGVLAAGAVATWLLLAPPERDGFQGDFAISAR